MLYTETYNNTTAHVPFCGYKLPMPDIPAMSLVQQPADGCFQHVHVPHDLRSWEHDKREAFISEQWHKRINGEWWLLKISKEALDDIEFPKDLLRDGKVLIYLPGWYWFFLNYWRADDKEDRRPAFRWTQCMMAHWWSTKIVMDDKCNGGFGFKGRRLGLSTLFQCMLYEYASRVRHVHCGIQHVNYNTAQEQTYMPIVNAHQEMAWFFKPVNQGTTDPKDGLMFKMPEDRITLKKIKDDINARESVGIFDDDFSKIVPLKSRITFRASKEGAYDGERLGRYFMEEPGKMTSKEMDPIECWNRVRMCTEVENGARIVGKALIASTVEEIEGKQDVLKLMTKFWEESDPFKKNELGKTTNGLKRIFIPATLSGSYDQYGFPLISRNKQDIELQIENLRKMRKLKDIAKIRRQKPITIDDVLTPSTKECHFELSMLQDRYKQLMHFKAMGDTRMPVMLDLIWSQRNRSVNVIQVPDANPEEDAVFWCSGLPPDFERNNVIVDYSGALKPANTHKYVIGVDPYQSRRDPENTDHKLSDGSFCVFRLFDPLLDGNKLVKDTNFPPENPDDQNYAGKEFESCRFVGTFRFRFKDPDEFCAYVAKAAILFGAKVMVENNKADLMEKYFNENGLKHFLWRDKKGNVGIAASGPAIQYYFDLLTIHVKHYVNSCWHPELILEWMQMKKEHTQPYDLGVASGWTLVLSNEPVNAVKKYDSDKAINFYAKRKKTFNASEFY